MKRLAIILFSLLFSLNTQAQDSPILEFEKPTKFKVEKIAAHADIDGNVLYLIFGRYKCHMKYFDKEMNLKNEFAFKKDFADEIPSFIGSSKKDNIISFFTQIKTEKKGKNEIEITAWEVNTNDLSNTKLEQKVISLKNADIITAYPKDDDFFFTYSPYESDAIKFVNLSDPKNSIKSFKLPGIKHDEFFDEKLWINVGDSEFIDFRSQISSRKYYHVGDILYLLSDKNSYSNLIKISLYNSTITINKLKSSKINLGIDNLQKTSSFLLKDRLFQFHASSEDGVLNIFNIDNNNLVKSYSFNKKMDKISFSNTQMTVINDLPKTILANRGAKNPKELLFKVIKHNPAITASLDINNNFLVQLGSIQSYTFNINHGNYWMHQNSMSFPPINHSQNIPNFHGPNFDNSWYSNNFLENLTNYDTKIVTFKTVLDGNTLEHISGKPKAIKHTDFDELVDEHDDSLKKNKVKFSTYKKYKYKDHYHKIGYNKKTKTIQVYEIKPKETSK